MPGTRTFWSDTQFLHNSRRNEVDQDLRAIRPGRRFACTPPCATGYSRDDAQPIHVACFVVYLHLHLRCGFAKCVASRAAAYWPPPLPHSRRKTSTWSAMIHRRLDRRDHGPSPEHSCQRLQVIARGYIQATNASDTKQRCHVKIKIACYWFSRVVRTPNSL